jgi:hypothetical protein
MFRHSTAQHSTVPQPTHLLCDLESIEGLQSEDVSVPVDRSEGHLQHGGEHLEGVFRVQDLSLQGLPSVRNKSKSNS